MALQTLVFSMVAYVLGSIPFGKLIAGRVGRIDITRRGSGNVGATNVARELGVKWGLVTLVLDMAKGFLPVLAFGAAVAESGTAFTACLSMVGLSALLGHQFSLFMGFRGGKGVATAFGAYLAISPVACLAALLLFVITVYIWDFVSLGSMVSALSLSPLLAVFGEPLPLVLGALAAAALICVQHRDNIGRLFRREERTWRGRKRHPSASSSRSNSSSE